jgi:hypothetical protein
MKASLLVVRWCVIAAPSLATGTYSAELKWVARKFIGGLKG